MQESCQATYTPAHQPYFPYSSPVSSIDRPISHVNLATAAEDAVGADVNYLDEDDQADPEWQPASPSWPRLRRTPVPDAADFDNSTAPEDADVKYPEDGETEWQLASPDSSSEQSEWESVPNVAASSDITAPEDADVRYLSDEETEWQPASPDSSSTQSEWESVHDVAASSDNTAPEDADVNDLDDDDEAEWQPATPCTFARRMASRQIEWEPVPISAAHAFSEGMAPAQPPVVNHVAAYRGNNSSSPSSTSTGSGAEAQDTVAPARPWAPHAAALQEPPTGVPSKQLHDHLQRSLNGDPLVSGPFFFRRRHIDGHWRGGGY